PSNRDDMPSIASEHFGDLASRLYQLTSRVEYVDISHIEDSTRLKPEMIRNLSLISYASGSSIGNVHQFIQLAQKNALTMQSLSLECRHDIDILGLVQDTEGNHVEYPRLLTLKLWSESDTDELRRPVFHGAAPFPILRRLRIHLECPFDDDTFFRGNAATLGVLDMRLDSASVSMLRKYKMFEPGRHLRLQVVKIKYRGGYDSESFTSPAEALQYMYNIGSGAAVRVFAQFRYPEDQVPTFSPLGSHVCIQVLSLPV
ncbi:hypothetical protein GGI19_006712, partial [Coemansia pectinata]